MQNRAQRRRFLGGLFVVALGSLTLYFSALANGPDVDLHFAREVVSDFSPAKLGEALRVTPNWPNWFYSTGSAEVIDAAMRPYPLKDQYIQRGSLVRMEMNPDKPASRRFQLLVAVADFEPGRRLVLNVVSDSSGKLLRLFKALSWKIELIPQGAGTLVRGTATARTASWRARLFGRLAEKIVMNQVFYPDLWRLAELKQPLPPNPFSEQ